MINEKIAMVGTPCQILAARKINQYKEETYGSPIYFKIGLFCMENFSYTYLKTFLGENDIEMDEIEEFRIEDNKFKVFLNDGKIFTTPLSTTDSFKRKNCDICMDYTADISDISIGSVGSLKGFSTVIIRSEKGKEIIEKGEAEGYFEVKDISKKGKQLLEKIANSKKEKNLKNIEKRESISRPVLSKREITDEDFKKLANECQFDNLESDVISEGACVLCGACEYVCQVNIVEINDRKPQKFGKCEENCHACYFACPRTYVSNEIIDNDLYSKPLGNYLDIVSIKAKFIEGQDGGAVSSILSYLIDKKLVDEVFIVGKDKNQPWKPKSKLTNNIEDILKAAGTKYSVAPIAFKALKEKSD